MITPIIDIAIESPLWGERGAIEELVLRAIAATFSRVPVNLRSGAELSVLLCDEARIRALNKNWRNVDAATNVLAFPAVAAEQLKDATILGDIAIAFESVDREARLEDKCFADHVSHLVVHGLLHLLGYDHANSVEAQIMEAIESSILHEIDIADPYANPLETPVR